MTLAGTNWTLAVIFVLNLALLRKTKCSPIAVMLLAGILNLLASVIQ